jgi:phosphoketolase
MATAEIERSDAGDCCRFPYTAARTVSAPDRESETARKAADCRAGDPVFARWAEGYGPIKHDYETQVHIHALAHALVADGRIADRSAAYRLLAAADRVAAAAMWLVVHMTYARNVYTDGRPLGADDFKAEPEGHTGGSLNMVPAYVGYLAANALAGWTRSWLMGQGHCVAGIDATNLMIGNTTRAHAERYATDEAGLTRFVRDFYSYAVRPDGSPESPLGSHVNAHTAGGLIEGGYLGFAELQYVHTSLPGEGLVVFLSDGAFEEQRGADWTPRWWRAEDCGPVTPIMILNGRRIEQRTQMEQEGGVAWFMRHLELNGFDPVPVDGTDPAAIAWSILESERRLEERAAAVASGVARYPVAIPYAIAETIKGFGFPGAGTNAAHNLPLGANPRFDEEARRRFNEGAQRLFVAPSPLAEARALLCNHSASGRPLERDHPAAVRDVALPVLPPAPWHHPTAGDASPMEGVDAAFLAIVEANPGLRPRVGNPDELRSNRMGRTLERLKHRVVRPETGIPESAHGAVITALNEEAVVSAALANKGGLNLVVSYEAFAVKMLGAIRQELIFARHNREAGKPPGWLAVPLIATSHTWENGKNEQSHQDPTFCEALLGEMTDVSHVLFPADWNSAIAALRAAYRAKGSVWTLVVPKRPMPYRFDAAAAEALVERGGARVEGDGSERVALVAVGAYQLAEALRAAARLRSRGVAAGVIYLIEPGRLRVPRDAAEAAICLTHTEIETLLPRRCEAIVVLTHTRPEPMTGVLRRIAGMLFANRCTWAHAVAAAATALGVDPHVWLDAGERNALAARADPGPILAAIRGGRGS